MTHKLEFSLRDAKRGSQLLEQLGHTEQVMLTNQFNLFLTEEREQELRDEMSALGLEFELNRV